MNNAMKIMGRNRQLIGYLPPNDSSVPSDFQAYYSIGVDLAGLLDELDEEGLIKTMSDTDLRYVGIIEENGVAQYIFRPETHSLVKGSISFTVSNEGLLQFAVLGKGNLSHEKRLFGYAEQKIDALVRYLENESNFYDN